MADACAYRNCDEAPTPGRSRCPTHLAMDARHQSARRKRLGLSAPSCDRCDSDEHSTAGCPDRAADEAAPIRRRLPVVEDPWPELPEDALPPRPRTRGDCEDGPRPCPWVSCKHHLMVDVRPSGNLQFNFAEDDLDDGRETCALDLAEREGMSLEAVGDVVGVNKERIRQIEAKALGKLRGEIPAALIDDYEEIPMPTDPTPPASPVPAVAVAPAPEPPPAKKSGRRGHPSSAWTPERRAAHSAKIREAKAASRRERAARLQAEDAARAAPPSPAETPATPPPPDSLGELLQQAGSLARIAAKVQELPRADLEVYIGPRRGERIAELERALEYLRGYLVGVDGPQAAAARARIEQVLSQ